MNISAILHDVYPCLGRTLNSWRQARSSGHTVDEQQYMQETDAKWPAMENIAVNSKTADDCFGYVRVYAS